MNSKFNVLVVGDIILDRYTYVSTKRNAPEAAIPVWDTERTEVRLGGAANVAHNLKALGKDEVSVYLAGIVGLKGQELISQFEFDTGLLTAGDTMEKHRYVCEDQILFRSDNIQKFSDSNVRFFSVIMREWLWNKSKFFDGFDAIVFSDYDKGTINKEVVDIIRETAYKPIIIDSKRKDLRLYEGLNVLKVNEKEYETQVASQLYPSVERLFDYVVVTKGAKGADLRQCEQVKSNDHKYMVHTENFPVVPVEAPVDVTGCGDTHTAAMAFSLLKTGGDIRAAVKFANVVAKSVVQKFGTSVPNDVV